MAPMTRSRAIGNVPNEIMARYYAERAAAGLIITEGTSPSINGLGYCRIPGVYTDAQVAGWKQVTSAVHQAGGAIFVQIMHTGRIGHPDNLPDGGKVVGPSAIQAPGEIWTDTKQMQPHPVPEPIATNELPAVIAEYVHAARCAVEAGFDGVEIHAANGYLPMQFLNPNSNHRTDEYGGSPENRNRFVLELAQAVADAIGKEKTGIRLSPLQTYKDATLGADEEAQYLSLAAGLGKIGLVYLHMLTFSMPPQMTDAMRHAFGSTTILNGGYTGERALADLEAERCELVSFGTPFIANPDFVNRLKNGAELAAADRSTFFTPGEKGYLDYPLLQLS